MYPLVHSHGCSCLSWWVFPLPHIVSYVGGRCAWNQEHWRIVDYTEFNRTIQNSKPKLTFSTYTSIDCLFFKGLEPYINSCVLLMYGWVSILNRGLLSIYLDGIAMGRVVSSHSKRIVSTGKAERTGRPTPLCAGAVNDPSRTCTSWLTAHKYDNSHFHKSTPFIYFSAYSNPLFILSTRSTLLL